MTVPLLRGRAPDGGAVHVRMEGMMTTETRADLLRAAARDVRQLVNEWARAKTCGFDSRDACPTCSARLNRARQLDEMADTLTEVPSR